MISASLGLVIESLLVFLYKPLAPRTVHLRSQFAIICQDQSQTRDHTPDKSPLLAWPGQLGAPDDAPNAKPDHALAAQIDPYPLLCQRRSRLPGASPRLVCVVQDDLDRSYYCLALFRYPCWSQANAMQKLAVGSKECLWCLEFDDTDASIVVAKVDLSTPALLPQPHWVQQIWRHTWSFVLLWNGRCRVSQAPTTIDFNHLHLGPSLPNVS